MKRLLFATLTILIVASAFAAQSTPPQRIYRGPESGLPATLGYGVLAQTTDTGRIFLGMSSSKREIESQWNKGQTNGYCPLDGNKKVPVGYINVAALDGIQNVEYDNGVCTTAATISAANGQRQKVTLTNAQNCVLTFTQPVSGTKVIGLKVIQSSAGSFNGTISGGKWPAATVPTITATSGAVDFISCYLDGTNAYCAAQQDFR